jgi:GntR family transcriptional regulator, transcriptional repressor for pyruvate dehydrogenase complex
MGLEMKLGLMSDIGPVPSSGLSAPTMQFEAIRTDHTRIYEAVAEQIQRRILDDLEPGDALPPERELVRMFRVSRGSIRDAIRKLELLGLVKASQGSRTIVREPSAEALSAPLTRVLLQRREVIAELLDFRKMLEPPLARRAALHASEEQLAEMEEILRRQQTKVELGNSTIEEDSRFHYCIARSAKNGVVLKVLDVLMDLLRKTRQQTLQTVGRQQKSLAGHRRILAAIKQRDAVRAETAMERHLAEIERIVLQKL